MPTESKKILIVEDEAISAIYMQTQLMNRGYPSILASSGEEAVEKISQNISVVLMDITLNGELDGIDAAFFIKKQKNIPIIFVTSNDYMKQDSRFEKIKPDGFFSKPLEINMLVNKIKQIEER